MRRTRIPWFALCGVGVVLLLVGSIVVYVLTRASSLTPYQPSASDPDPSRRLAGVTTVDYPGQRHVRPDQRVAYDQSPPFGGPHDGAWAACTGTVYPAAVRTENMVHSLEHGAVWISYDPARVTAAALDQLAKRVTERQYLALSPYPGLDRPISLQAWGRQLKLDDPTDPRIDQFIRALRQNPATSPEPGASCDALGPGLFDPQNPPPFDPSPPGPGAVPVQATGPQGPAADK